MFTKLRTWCYYDFVVSPIRLTPEPTHNEITMHGGQIKTIAAQVVGQLPDDVEFSKEGMRNQLGDILTRLHWRDRYPSPATFNRWLNAINVDPSQSHFDRDELEALVNLGGWYHLYRRDGAAKYRDYRHNH
mgnify:CR=1 FL=1